MLTIKQLKFVAGIVKGLSKTQAAINAGYSKKGAATQGSRLFEEKEIQGEIEKQLAGQAWTPARVIAELTDLYQQARSLDDARGINAAKDILVLLGRHVGVLRDERRVTHTQQFELLLDEATSKDITPHPLQLEGSRVHDVSQSQESDTDQSG